MHDLQDEPSHAQESTPFFAQPAMLLAQGGLDAQAPSVALPSCMIDEDDIEVWLQVSSFPHHMSCSYSSQGMVHEDTPTPLHSQGNPVLFTSCQDAPLQQRDTLREMLAPMGLNLDMILTHQHQSSHGDDVCLVTGVVEFG